MEGVGVRERTKSMITSSHAGGHRAGVGVVQTLYAGMNCFIHAGKGRTVSRPNGSRNMRKSRKKRPSGKPPMRKER